MSEPLFDPSLKESVQTLVAFAKASESPEAIAARAVLRRLKDQELALAGLPVLAARLDEAMGAPCST